MKILVINGPNLNMLGIREPDHYGRETYADLIAKIEAHCQSLGMEVECFQSNHEGDLVDKIQEAYGNADGIVINPGAYTHTSIALLDAVKDKGLDSIGVGKIHDIFAGIGLTEHVYNKSNADGMAHTDHFAQRGFEGLCFVNLVDFDMQFGHRRDIDGYARALSEFDAWLGEFVKNLGEEDVVMITADHGCDPAYTATTDHTREYVPLLVLGKKVKPVNLGTRSSFADIAATVAELLDVKLTTPGKSFASEIL